MNDDSPGATSDGNGANPESNPGSNSDSNTDSEPLITPSLVLKAYSVGLFPMAESADDPDLIWIDPDMRGVIPLDDGFHIPRSLRKAIRRNRDLAFTTDLAFDDVIAACAAPAPDRRTTWINRPIRRLYSQLHRQGYAHSIECWRRDALDRPVLAGGIYGVSLGAAFFGESMFSRRTNASKMCLVTLVDCLRQGGYQLFDAQFVTDHLSQFGALEIPRSDYQLELAEAIGLGASWPAPGPLDPINQAR